MTRACKNCDYYQDFARSDDGGECRRLSPVPSRDTGTTYWPDVKFGDWCGEFKSNDPIDMDNNETVS